MTQTERRPTRVDQLVERIAFEISTGALAPGSRLASVREAADLQDCSRNTVVAAYERLVALGVIDARRGSGFFVRGRLAAPARETPAHFAAAVDIVSLLREQLYQRGAVRVGEGRPPVAWMEGSELGARLRAPRLSGLTDPDGHEGDDYEYGNPWGFTPLRERIASQLADRAIRVGPDRVLLTHGANHALDLVIRHLVQAGEPVLVDSPGYYPLFGKLTLTRARMIGVPRTVDGPDLDALEHQLRTTKARLFFTQSLAHNPTGGSLTPPVAHHLLRLAARFDLRIIEDDPFADLMPPSAVRLAALDRLERVIYISSFSKTLSASLRVGYVVGPADITGALCDLKTVTVVTTSAHSERLVHQLIVGGHYRRHLRRLGRRLATATDDTLAALRQLGLAVETPRLPSYYAWLQLPDPIDVRQLTRAAAAEDIFLAPGHVFMPEREIDVPAMRIHVAHATDRRFLTFMQNALRPAGRNTRMR